MNAGQPTCPQDVHLTLDSLAPPWSHTIARANCPHVLRFCAQLGPSTNPVVVPVRPELLYGGGPYALGRCYEGVDKYVSRVGGVFQHGWMIWKCEGIYLRAYHHCVHWDGRELTDVSFQTHREILFLPTAEPGVTDVAYRAAKEREEPVGVGCCYFPLSNSALARRIISLHETKDGAGKYSPEWFRMLHEITELEDQFHEWKEVKCATARRRKATRRRLQGWV